ncbi:hypothetical protein K469DRAFT_758730 [Zopfia rhizophila CBS 207.26]|uniref:Uncharacterized protein n=1 Tax=Zopfia rhizophila CBS 207.26 TaxID=1314779 RepID=A0A6A6EXP9_9PEZI|nr:hypothetical protein K469DRAFT_758730 [Zopfia rhizophila CBS 207.26]
MSQWRNWAQWWALESYNLDVEPWTANTKVFGLGSSLLFSAGLIKWFKKVRVDKDAEGRILVFTSCMSEKLFYIAFREKISDPRRTIMTSSSLEEITKDAYIYAQLDRNISDLTSATESLLEVLAMNLGDLRGFRTLPLSYA